MKFTFEADMVKGQCYRCPLWEETYDENGGWTEYCILDSTSEAHYEDPDDCPLKESTEVVWHPYPKEKPTEKNGYVVSVVDESNGYRFTETSFYHPNFDRFEIEDAYQLHVYAWTERPKPYENS